jgi:hypothetical protein
MQSLELELEMELEIEVERPIPLALLFAPCRHPRRQTCHNNGVMAMK